MRVGLVGVGWEFVGEGEFVVGLVGWWGLAGTVAVVRGRGVADGEAFQARLQICGLCRGFARMVGLARACRVRAALLLRHMVRGPWHAAFSHTFGDRAIVTVYPPTRLSS